MQTHVARKGVERVKHVEAMKENDACGHRVVPQAHLIPDVHYEAGAFASIAGLLLAIYAVAQRGRAPQLALVKIPARHAFPFFLSLSLSLLFLL
jgi:hypothetical protein